MEVIILGGGCAKCEKLEENTKKAADEMGISIELGHVKKTNEIADFGVIKLPALVIGGNVVSMGKVLKPEQIKPLLKCD